MRTYRPSLLHPIIYLILAGLFGVGSLWAQDLLVFLLAATFLWGTAFEALTRVITTREGIAISRWWVPGLLRRKKAIRWSEIAHVRQFFNPLLPEGDLMVLEGSRRRVAIPIAILIHREHLLDEIASALPSHLTLTPAQREWARTTGTTPWWQLLIALGIILALATILLTQRGN